MNSTPLLAVVYAFFNIKSCVGISGSPADSIACLAPLHETSLIVIFLNTGVVSSTFLLEIIFNYSYSSFRVL